jgi:hypothetical protein
MRKLAMIADSNAHILREEPHHKKHEHRRPMEQEQRGHGSQMKRRNHDEKHPIEFLRLSLHHVGYFGDSFWRMRYNRCHGIPAFALKTNLGELPLAIERA